MGSAKAAIEELGGKVVLLTKHNKEITDAEQKDEVVAALAVHGFQVTGLSTMRPVVASRHSPVVAKNPHSKQWGIETERVTKSTTPRRKRHLRVHKKVNGTAERPRLCVHR